MNRARSDAKTISFLWKPIVFNMHWAESAGEVPEWDTSRGFPLSASASTFARVSLLEDTKYHIGEVEELLKLQQENGAPTIEILRSLLMLNRSLAGNAALWYPRDAPATGYPRLVRATYSDPSEHQYVDKKNVLNELSVLARYIQPWRERKLVKKLKDKVLELAQRYGYPFYAEDNTLEAWVQIIARVDVNMRVLRNLQREGYDLMLDQLKSKHGELKDEQEKNLAAEERSQRKPNAKLPLQHENHRFSLAHLDAAKQVELFLYNLLVLSGTRLQSVPKNQRAQHLRNDRAENLLSPFSSNPLCSSRVTYTLDTRGVTLHCPLELIVDYELSKMWQLNPKILVCGACSSLFIKKREGQKYCERRSCADKIYREREKVVAEQSLSPRALAP